MFSIRKQKIHNLFTQIASSPAQQNTVKRTTNPLVPAPKSAIRLDWRSKWETIAIV